VHSLLPLIGRIRPFAGEHTSDHPGWMQGALTTGGRATREVMKAREETSERGEELRGPIE
jgi:monoamine oxidase